MAGLGVLIVYILVGILIPTVIGGFLQRFLSKKENKWLGWILPCFTVFNAITMIFAMSGRDIFFILVVFLILNIPTAVYVYIYKVCRKKIDEELEAEKKKGRKLY